MGLDSKKVIWQNNNQYMIYQPLARSFGYPFPTRKDQALPAPKLTHQQKAHLQGWGYDMVRRAGLRSFASKLVSMVSTFDIEAKQIEQTWLQLNSSSSLALRSSKSFWNAGCPVHSHVWLQLGWVIQCPWGFGGMQHHLWLDPFTVIGCHDVHTC